MVVTQVPQEEAAITQDLPEEVEATLDLQEEEEATLVRLVEVEVTLTNHQVSMGLATEATHHIAKDNLVAHQETTIQTLTEEIEAPREVNRETKIGDVLVDDHPHDKLEAKNQSLNPSYSEGTLRNTLGGDADSVKQLKHIS
jgi:hypothetical protein